MSQRRMATKQVIVASARPPYRPSAFAFPTSGTPRLVENRMLSVVAPIARIATATRSMVVASRPLG